MDIIARGSVIREISAIRQSIVSRYINMKTGAAIFEVNSGTTCASVGSIESTRSTMMFFNEPLGMSSTVPSGRRASLSHSCSRTLPIKRNVVR